MAILSPVVEIIAQVLFLEVGEGAYFLADYFIVIP